jgi:hypothetical protein
MEDPSLPIRIEQSPGINLKNLERRVLTRDKKWIRTIN